MSIDTKGFIVGENKDVWAVRDSITSSIREYIVPKIKTDNYLQRFRLQSIDVRMSNSFQMLSFSFKDGGDERVLYVHFDCDGDCADITFGPKIIFSLGTWGNAEDLIKQVGMGLSRDFNSNFYYCPMDATDEWFWWQASEFIPLSKI